MMTIVGILTILAGMAEEGSDAGAAEGAPQISALPTTLTQVRVTLLLSQTALLDVCQVER